MTSTDTTLNQYLAEAHASEVGLVRVLQSQIAVAPRGELRQGLEKHLEETRDHAARLQRRMSELGEGSSTVEVVGGAVVAATQSVVAQGLAFAKTPIDLVRGSGGHEKVLKNAKDACATEALEIATYDALEQVAKSAGDRQTAELAASIRKDEERMLERLRGQIPALAAAVVGDRDFKVSQTGAADATRRTAKKTERKAKKSAARTRTAAKDQAGSTKAAAKSTAKSAADKAGKEAGIKEPFRGYDKMTVDEVKEKVSNNPDRADQVERYESSHEGRKGVLEAVSN